MKFFFEKTAKLGPKIQNFQQKKNKFLAKMPAGTSDFLIDSGPHAKN